ncbi:P-loop containing nucleoside triphosphate hydrolase protein [Eremomyces bilateralis CBS 781.70]|uniref:P-loop containing nucleoside triphosphate hydrolase protein n=1 Tax=Eremomyces bilateralis CBS 781.70 TaxID=1392243 RepID=A0A6G1FSM3_9PEZI|nr:P-loop containing nucleoside triphosphate hydrolase protein [Eremomyces bilateralis CBS 781.70]KAF1808736.1 P-loop containing nucleoside triphosphate hydrolase protein [Eremomyces bilateralis CBS 781.70]
MVNQTNSSFGFAGYSSQTLRSFSPLPDLVAPLAAFTGVNSDTLLLVSFIFFALPSSAIYFFRAALDHVLDYITSTVYIREDDELYTTFMSWLLKHDSSKSIRCGEIYSDRSEGAWWTDDAKYDDFENAALADLNRPVMNFSEMNALIPPSLSPYFNTENRIWHNRRLFLITRIRRLAGRDEREVEEIRIRTVGLTTKSILSLLVDVQEWNAKENSDSASTSIYCIETRGYVFWRRAGERPSRPLSTVDMDDDMKSTIVSDMNDFFRPKSRLWYARRGIPYRRGYLLSGPPGTGKSSLSFALASTFGLSVYIITIRDPEINDAVLGAAFRDLPERCLVLLEDIDSAGLGDKRGKREDDSEEASSTGSRVGKPKGRGEIKTSVTLSGLLNAIDGVGGHEGHVLLMTTNHPEKLDPALVRPGRVDFLVNFSLATSVQVKHIFLRMYLDDASPMKCAEKERDWTESELKDLSEQFAAQVPSSKFSPAEIQNFLITRKREPQSSVDEIGTWVKKALKSKATGEGE